MNVDVVPKVRCQRSFTKNSIGSSFTLYYDGMKYEMGGSL